MIFVILYKTSVYMCTFVLPSTCICIVLSYYVNLEAFSVFLYPGYHYLIYNIYWKVSYISCLGVCFSNTSILSWLMMVNLMCKISLSCIFYYYLKFFFNLMYKMHFLILHKNHFIQYKLFIFQFYYIRITICDCYILSPL